MKRVKHYIQCIRAAIYDDWGDNDIVSIYEVNKRSLLGLIDLCKEKGYYCLRFFDSCKDPRDINERKEISPWYYNATVFAPEKASRIRAIRYNLLDSERIAYTNLKENNLYIGIDFPNMTFDEYRDLYGIDTDSYDVKYKCICSSKHKDCPDLTGANFDKKPNLWYNMHKFMGDNMLEIKNEEYKKLKQREMEQIKHRREVAEYFGKDRRPVIVSLNDSQGLFVGLKVYKKSYVGHITQWFKDEYLCPVVANCSSWLFNKTEDIDNFLDHNIDLEQNNQIQRRGMVVALEKAMRDNHIPLSTVFGKVGHLSSTLYRSPKEDKEKGITSIIRDAYRPIVLYSCGANDLMRAIGSNPSTIQKDLKDKVQAEQILKNARDPKIVEEVIARIEKNFQTIYGINRKANICALSIYVPKSLQSEEMKIFKDVIEDFNRQLKELCEKYKVMYTDVSEIGAKESHDGINFHISPEGHEKVAEAVVEKLHERISEGEFILPGRFEVRQHYTMQEMGILGVEDALKDKARAERILASFYEAKKSSDTIDPKEKPVFEYKARRTGEIIQEFESRADVCRKVYEVSSIQKKRKIGEAFLKRLGLQKK